LEYNFRVPDNRERTGKAVLNIKGLTVMVSGKEILTDINLELKKGHTLALLGPNGSGKTSLLMAIMGFSDYKIVRGDIIFRNRRINDLNIDERARLGLGIMFQRPPTVRGITLEQMIALIDKQEFDISSESREMKLREFLSRDINLGFSGGELKRCELLQLLSLSPRLSLFDEPESGVDLENMALVGRAMNRILNKDKDNASLIITHTGYIFDYVTPDRACVLVGGRLHCAGEARGILETIKKHGYEWCVKCEGERLKDKSHTRKK